MKGHRQGCFIACTFFRPGVTAISYIMQVFFSHVSVCSIGIIKGSQTHHSPQALKNPWLCKEMQFYEYRSWHSLAMDPTPLDPLLEGVLGLWCKLGPCWRQLGYLGSNFVPTWGPSWFNLAPTSPNLGNLGANLEHLGSNLVPTWSHPGPSWPQLRPT